jgi:nitrate reductase NapD
MNDTPQKLGIDRRGFLHGRWPVRLDDGNRSVAEIASVLVQVRPEKMEAAAQAIEALPGAEIFSRDAKGKLVVVLEASDVGLIGTMLNTISLMPHVLSAALVFHGTDEA